MDLDWTNKFSRYLRIFQPPQFAHELASRVGTQARSDRATVLMLGTGRRWRD